MVSRAMGSTWPVLGADATASIAGLGAILVRGPIKPIGRAGLFDAWQCRQQVLKHTDVKSPAAETVAFALHCRVDRPNGGDASHNAGNCRVNGNIDAHCRRAVLL